MRRWLTKIHCRLSGHIMETKTFDGRGRRLEIAACLRCKHVDAASSRVTARNRALRRRAARTVAREIAR